MTRPLSEQTVVLTGASSGIGRATAIELGRRRANVVLAARTEESLRDVALEVEAAGGQAAAVVTDVADWKQVEHLADLAVDRFGRIDTWVNDAGVSTYARVEDATVEEIDRILRVNLHGPIHGMKAALPIMRKQGGGTIVNVSSVLGKFSVPLQAAYCASKHGLLGFADSLRLELKREDSPIEICSILPGSTNTPFFEHARAKLGGHRPQPLPPANDPQAVADAICFVCENPRREVIVGAPGKVFEVVKRVSPHLLDWMLLAGDTAAKGQVSDRPDDGKDNLDSPPPARSNRVKGEWDNMDIGGSPYTRVFEQHPPLKALAVGAAGLVAAGFLRRLAGR